MGSNISAHVVQTKDDWASAEADVVIRRHFLYDRGTAAAMENRGIVAHWESKPQHLTVWDTTQAPIPIRNELPGFWASPSIRCG